MLVLLRSRFTLASVALLSVAFASACGDDGSPTGSTCPPDSTLTYATFGEAFISQNCLRCHATKESPTLTSQAAIQANASRIDRMAAAGPKAVNTAMPEDASISEAERRKLGEWLACGAP